ncbi:uncharacterized protein LY89DRAFT_630357 [Mollisia scopiformis]|uniref:Ubiquitin-like domain-containing protein n=1 Tax=Mollisia scopiformis TaxID=149040 RepID=A0A132B6B6_MOLSC|nr:uncharacterized protein LY89DRAFT_630357 [Mollisia scopiformis]KUJ07948.1 hypothetical protein LY89DRAFT_630357 [Mollisia scopiformis]
MGCCASTPSNASPYPQQANSSSRAITSSQPQSQAALPRPSTNASNHSHRPHPQRARDLTSHPSQPLKLHTWTSKNKTWTPQDLDRERTEFFDTRVTGRAEIWQALKATLEVLWNGGDPGDNDGGLATAQMILDAAGITIPSGDLAGGVYDAFGNHYSLPEHIVANPANLTVAPPADDDDDKTGDEGSEIADEETIIRRREEKGKGVLNEADLVEIRAKLSDRESQPLRIIISKQDSVRLVMQKLFDASDLQSPRYIKIAYMGKILKEGQTLQAQGWKEGHVVNALVFGGT